MADLKRKPENRGKNIRIDRGKLLIDGIVVDKNTFFV